MSCRHPRIRGCHRQKHCRRSLNPLLHGLDSAECTSDVPVVVVVVVAVVVLVFWQVTDALVPRILTLTADTSLPEAMRAFRLTRNEFAVVVAGSGFGTYDASAPPPQTGINGDDASGWHAQTILAEVGSRELV